MHADPPRHSPNRQGKRSSSSSSLSDPKRTSVGALFSITPSTHHASIKGDVAAVQALIDAEGSDPSELLESIDEFGSTPLIIPANLGRDDVMTSPAS